MSKILVVNEGPRQWWVTLQVGPQSFHIGGVSWDTRAEARWYARQFKMAINIIKGTGVRFDVYQFRGRGPRVKVKIKRKR